MSSASTHGRRRRPAGEGVCRYYRSLDPCLCPWGEMWLCFVVMKVGFEP